MEGKMVYYNEKTNTRRPPVLAPLSHQRLPLGLGDASPLVIEVL
jgi:hypothetical protein